ncbi:MAG: sigma-54 dependent transcriptional regulator [Vicinamibacterales bacterium]|nr:sigma-54 dependent transcriptional regulator [Vicinamibacterales bacterium]
MPSSRKTILIVDPDEPSRERLGQVLRRDARILKAASGEAGLGLMAREDVSLVLAAIALPGVSGFDLLRIIRENYPLTEIVMVSAQSDVESAVQAVKLGAYDVLQADAAPDAVRAALAHAGERQDLSRQVLALSAQVEEQGGREFVTGPSLVAREMMDLVDKVAGLSATVLILGESGTGKELVARRIHQRSGQPDAPFIPVNVAAIPRELVESTLFGHEKGAFTGAVRQQIGKFELAHGGTLFLDEIGDLKQELQAKLLRAIQEGEIERVGGATPIRVNFRLIAATNVDLARAVKEGAFREDLYYRLNVIPVRLPPLRERLEDLPALADFFLRRYNARFHKQVQGIAESTLRMLAGHWWPGNVRELENLIERLVATSDGEWITDDDLPFEFHVADIDRDPGQHLLDRVMTTFERNFIIRALERSAWNVTQTARYLGIPLSTLKFKMDRLEIRGLARKIKGDR